MATDAFEISRTAADRSVTDLLPPELVQLGKDAGAVISVFSSVKSAVDVTVSVLKVLGVLLLFALY
jgi:hypothetical protein